MRSRGGCRARKDDVNALHHGWPALGLLWMLLRPTCSKQTCPKPQLLCNTSHTHQPSRACSMQDAEHDPYMLNKLPDTRYVTVTPPPPHEGDVDALHHGRHGAGVGLSARQRGLDLQRNVVAACSSSSSSSSSRDPVNTTCLAHSHALLIAAIPAHSSSTHSAGLVVSSSKYASSSFPLTICEQD
jgi:hypothetical protein